MKHNIISFLLVAAFIACSYPARAAEYVSPTHVFSVDDIIGDFNGKTYGYSGAGDPDPSILCGIAGSPPCPEGGASPFQDKEGVTLYPIDSEFGFHVTDFEGAEPKSRDDDYMEGFAGNIEEGGQVVGLKVSNAATDTFKVKPPLGTWCQGLGATSVKCSTEHYTVMEHVLTCFETVPYFFATPISFNPYFLQGETCAELDNTLFTPADIQIDSQDSLDQLPPNDNTNLVDVAKSTDYSLTKKDDGKVLYRWGSLIKRPNDVRLYARLALPDEWKEEDADYTVTKAILIVDHWITNNPNDQLRAEDLENEGATGRKPSYEITDNGNWVSTRECYEGDGDFIGIEDEGDPTVLDIGTVFKRPSIPEDYFTLQGDSPPLPFSKDLKEYFTNAWYTSINRDPFEWSYRNTSKGDNVFDFIGSPGPLIDEELELVSGPRWRLKANKFGQDLPGLEIPLEECSAPPFTNDNIKYRVGERVETIINLLDWDKDETSPLATSTGWVDVTANDGVVVNDIVDGVPVTTNGCPMSDDFDLAVYIKGDRKPTAIFSARLEISYVSAIGSPMEADFAIVSYGLQTSGPRALGEKSTKSKRKSNVVTLGEEVTIFWVIHNLGTAASNGTTSANCQDNRGRNYNLVPNPIVFRIDAGGEYEARATFTPIGSRTLKFSCSLTTSPTSEGVSDTNLENNIVENFRFKAKKKRSKK